MTANRIAYDTFKTVRVVAASDAEFESRFCVSLEAYRVVDSPFGGINGLSTLTFRPFALDHISPYGIRIADNVTFVGQNWQKHLTQRSEIP